MAKAIKSNGPRPDTKHDDYLERHQMWVDCRKVKEGGRAVKEGGDEYLPKMGNDYEAYKLRANFFNATDRTVGGYLGMAFRKPPAVEMPDRFGSFTKDDYLRSVTRDGVSFDVMAVQTFEEVVTVGRVGVLVDMEPGDDSRNRAYFATYKTEHILNWKEERINGRTMLVMLALQETYDVEDAEDEFATSTRGQVRVLRLRMRGVIEPEAVGVEGGISIDEAKQYVYSQEVWRKKVNTDGSEADEWELVEGPMMPLRRGQGIPFIPFFIANVWDTTMRIPKPPLIDLVDVNLSHYRTSADLENGRHWGGVPTPWATGIDNEQDALEVGGGTAWMIENDKAKVGMLEYTGQGLESLENAEDKKEKQMAVLGARLLEEQQKDSEAAETVRLRQSGEQSVLAGMVETVSEMLTTALSFAIWWMGANGVDEAEVLINKDFFDQQMETDDLLNLVKVWQMGGISKRTLYYLRQRGEVTRPDVDFEDEEAEIAQEEPALVPGAEDGGEGGEKEEDHEEISENDE